MYNNENMNNDNENQIFINKMKEEIINNRNDIEMEQLGGDNNLYHFNKEKIKNRCELLNRNIYLDDLQYLNDC